MIVLDASLVIAHLESRDTHHERASSYLRHRAGERFVMHSLNLAEVLVGGARVGRAEEMLHDLEAMGIDVADIVEGEPLRLAELRAATRLKMPDCCALDVAMTSGALALATFDDALAEAARARGLAVEPTA